MKKELSVEDINKLWKSSRNLLISLFNLIALIMILGYLFFNFWAGIFGGTNNMTDIIAFWGTGTFIIFISFEIVCLLGILGCHHHKNYASIIGCLVFSLIFIFICFCIFSDISHIMDNIIFDIIALLYAGCGISLFVELYLAVYTK